MKRWKMLFFDSPQWKGFTRNQKILWECSFECLTIKFHNCHHANVALPSKHQGKSGRKFRRLRKTMISNWTAGCKKLHFPRWTAKSWMFCCSRPFIALLFQWRWLRATSDLSIALKKEMGCFKYLKVYIAIIRSSSRLGFCS